MAHDMKTCGGPDVCSVCREMLLEDPEARCARLSSKDPQRRNAVAIRVTAHTEWRPFERAKFDMPPDAYASAYPKRSTCPCDQADYQPFGTPPEPYQIGTIRPTWLGAHYQPFGEGPDSYAFALSARAAAAKRHKETR